MNNIKHIKRRFVSLTFEFQSNICSLNNFQIVCISNKSFFFYSSIDDETILEVFVTKIIENIIANRIIDSLIMENEKIDKFVNDIIQFEDDFNIISFS